MTILIQSFGNELTKLAGVMDNFRTQSFGPDRKLLGMPPAVKQVSSGWTKDKYGLPTGSRVDRQQAKPPGKKVQLKAKPSQLPKRREFMSRGSGRVRQTRGRTGALKMRY